MSAINEEYHVNCLIGMIKAEQALVISGKRKQINLETIQSELDGWKDARKNRPHKPERVTRLFGELSDKRAFSWPPEDYKYLSGDKDPSFFNKTGENTAVNAKGKTFFFGYGTKVSVME